MRKTWLGTPTEIDKGLSKFEAFRPAASSALYEAGFLNHP